MVLSYERVDRIPQCYILERWSKNIKRRHTSIKSSYDEPLLEPRNMKYDGMISRSKVHCEVASGCEVLTAMVHSAYDKLEADMKEYKAKSDVQSILRHEDGSERMMDELHTPGRVRSRGRLKKRLGSVILLGLEYKSDAISSEKSASAFVEVR
ncbi:hypothetical protein PIB30_056788 [Stylosanthes scabra]|uniref:Protein FAR1-RELATED SEQUENCE n=1 Tax=Stylosanthes scabra TaxID=79078 RepID=A0ABU6QJV0_9FABA|nr:hypothetical protein [Stylosanthes scabra]